MTVPASALWLRAERRALSLEPALAAQILRAVAALRLGLGGPAVAHWIQTGNVDALVGTILSDAAMAQAVLPVREELRRAVLKGAKYVRRDMPSPPAPPPPPIGPVAPAPTLAVRMDLLNPRVVDAIRTMETRSIGTLQEDIRATVRQTMERGLVAGQNPTVIARELRDVIGLAPNQEAAVQSFRAALLAGDRDALTRQLRDRRYDRTLEKALGKDGAGLSPDQVDRMVAAYRKRMLAWNAETNARTMSHEAYQIGQKLAIADGVKSGALDGDRLVRQWIGVGDDRERPEHFAMNNSVVPWDEPYPNGDRYAGESSPWNCRCVDLFRMR